MSKLFDDASLAMIPSAYKDGKLYSIRPTDGSGDFTFSRGSNLAATRVDVNGLIEKGRENLLLQSNQFDTTWFTNAGGSVTSGQSGYDGSNDAWLLSSTTGSQYASLRQTIATSGVTTASFYAKANTLNFIVVSVNGNAATYQWFDLANGVVGTNLYGNEIDASIESVGNGWYRCSLTFSDNNIVSARAYPVGADNTFTTTSGSIYIQDAQLEQGLVATDYIETGTSAAQSGILEDMPRLDYSGGASCPSLLLEPQRSNLVTQSEYFGAWDIVRANSVANSSVSPDGTSNAYKLEANVTGLNGSWFRKILSSFSGNYEFSVFAKAGTTDFLQLRVDGTGGVIFDLSDGTIKSEENAVGSVLDYGNGWYRCSIQLTASSSTALLIIVGNENMSTSVWRSTNGDSAYIYGAQLESGSYPTSYIPTYGTSQTRTHDVCKITGSNATDIIDNPSMTLFAEWTTDTSNPSTKIMGIIRDNDGSFYNNFIAFTERGDLKAAIEVRAGGSLQSFISSNPLTNGNHKAAVVMAENNVKLFVDGVLIVSDTSATIPNDLDEIYLAGYPDSTARYGTKKSFLYFPTALTDSECIALTTL